MIMTHIRFKDGDEVTVITPKFDDDSDRYEHLTVKRLVNNGSRVVLSDCSAWRQDGRPWGHGRKYFSRYHPCLVERATGLEHEHNQALATRVNSLQRTFDGLVKQLASTRIADLKDRDYCAAKCAEAEKLVLFLRNMEDL